MNTLMIYPKKFRELYIKNIKNAGIIKAPEQYHNFIFTIIIILSILSLPVFYFLNLNLLFSLVFFIIINIFFYMKTSLKATMRIRKMETVFPDVVSLMASNLKSGITIEKAFLLSARPEFDPLDKEILKTGKEITTGKDVIDSLKKMAIKTGSEKISKTVNLIVSGLRAGGNIAELLEQTSKNMKEQELLEKKTASATLMYVIFIFVAVGVGAPVLFGLSSVLVEIVINITGQIPEIEYTQVDLPFTFSKITISLNFVIYFALAFLIVTDLISCFVIGIVNKGEGKTGLKFFLPILALSLTIFLIVRNFVSKILLKSIGFI